MIVLTGGQTGADQGGTFAAADAGVRTGGYVPNGWRTDAGPAPWLEAYGLQEHPSRQYRPRTIANVRMATSLLWFGDHTSPGGRLTHETAQLCTLVPLSLAYPSQEPHADLYYVAFLKTWLQTENLARLMVAGNRERTNPGIQQFVRTVLGQVFKELQGC